MGKGGGGASVREGDKRLGRVGKGGAGVTVRKGDMRLGNGGAGIDAGFRDVFLVSLAADVFEVIEADGREPEAM